MRLFTSSLIIATLVLSGCGNMRDSRIHPSNWFSKRQVSEAQSENTNPLIPKKQRVSLFRRADQDDAPYLGQPVDVVKDLTIERTSEGLILRANAVSQMQNLHSLQLTPVHKDEKPVNGVLAFRLEGVTPFQPLIGGSERLRTVVVARALNSFELRGVKRIEVRARNNTRSIRLR